jgi:tetratricopeptide (TPR) repeat protein
LMSSEELAFRRVRIYLIQRAVALDTNSARSLAWLIPRLVSAGDTSQAIECYYKLHRASPTSRFRDLYGEVGQAWGFYSKGAVVFFLAAIQRDRDNYFLHRDLGDLYSSILERDVVGRGVKAKNQLDGFFYTYLDSAVAEYETAIKLNPHASAPHVGLASVRLIEGDTTRALSSLMSAFATNDTTIPMTAFYDLIDIGRLDDASRLAGIYLKNPRRRCDAYAGIATSYFTEGNDRRAEEYFLRSLAENVRSLNAEDAIGRIYARSGNESYRSLLGCEVIAHDGVFVATVSADTTRPLSLLKTDSPGLWFTLPDIHMVSPASRHNLESPYGGMHGLLSPFNQRTTTPPRIMRGESFVAYLTDNPTIKPRVSATRLVGYLSELQRIKNTRKQN